MKPLNRASNRNTRERLAALRSRKWVCAVNAFMRSPWYVALLALLCAASAVFSLELPVYTLFILAAVFACLLGEDLLPLMPVVIFCYIAPSPENNPGRFEDSVFYPGNGLIYLVTLGVILVVCVVYRLVTDENFGGKRFLTAKRSLMPGMLALGGAYLLSGLGMKGYTDIFFDNLLFAAIEFASVILMYYLFSGSVNWKHTPKAYLAWIAVAAGFVVLAELMENYISGRAFVAGTTTIDRELMHTGWGMHNNIGLMMAMCMPFAFYLTCRHRRGWIFTAMGAILLVGVIASCSRTSMIVALLTFAACTVILMHRSVDRKLFIRGFLLIVGVVAIGIVLMWSRLTEAFRLFLDGLTAISSRDKIYVNGLKQLLQHPIFGGSFYPQTEYVPWDWASLDSFSSHFPPRWHNTLIQVGASCGFVGLAAYAFHRVQTVKLLLRNVTAEKLFIFISMVVLLACGMLDCHFFNVGPVLFYSMALAFGENIEKSELA